MALYKSTIRNHSPGLAGRGGPDRRSKSMIKLFANKQIADKLSGPWSETRGLGGVFNSVASLFTCSVVKIDDWLFLRLIVTIAIANNKHR